MVDGCTMARTSTVVLPAPELLKVTWSAGAKVVRLGPLLQLTELTMSQMLFCAPMLAQIKLAPPVLATIRSISPAVESDSTAVCPDCAKPANVRLPAKPVRVPV